MAKSNVEKHDVSFEEALTVFADEFARMIFDPDHSKDEDHFIIFLGLSIKTRILVVIHCYKGSEDLIRINSARKATRTPTISGGFMRKEYDFSSSVKNPFAKRMKKQITIRIEAQTIEYFKKLAEETGISYQNLMNSYLTDCAQKGLKPEVKWA